MGSGYLPHFALLDLPWLLLCLGLEAGKTFTSHLSCRHKIYLVTLIDSRGDITLCLLIVMMMLVGWLSALSFSALLRMVTTSYKGMPAAQCATRNPAESGIAHCLGWSSYMDAPCLERYAWRQAKEEPKKPALQPTKAYHLSYSFWPGIVCTFLAALLTFGPSADL